MIKLISLNMEDIKHYATVVPFLTKEQAEVVCLQEAPETFCTTLEKLGYHTSFAALCKKELNNETVTIGLIAATKVSHQATAVYYHEPVSETVLYNTEDREHSLRIPYLKVTLSTGPDDETYTIITTHLVDSKNGKEDNFQVSVFQKLQEKLGQEPEHIICGDFNMPRGYNALYPLMVQTYTDRIPTHYTSSLDRNLHRLGKVDIPEKIFDDFMVDYIFTTKDYTATEVSLTFGVSDHAAVIGYIQKVANS